MWQFAFLIHSFGLQSFCLTWHYFLSLYLVFLLVVLVPFLHVSVLHWLYWFHLSFHCTLFVSVAVFSDLHYCFLNSEFSICIFCCCVLVFIISFFSSTLSLVMIYVTPLSLSRFFCRWFNFFCLTQSLFWLRLSFWVTWWPPLRFVLPDSVYLFLLVNVASFFVSFWYFTFNSLWTLSISVCFSFAFSYFSFCSFIYFYLLLMLKLRSIYKRLMLVLHVYVLLFCWVFFWNLFFCGVFTFEVKPTLAIPTLYSCFIILITYWAYVS